MAEMETKNIYSKPIEEKDIIKISSASPAHRKYYSEEADAEYDLSYAVDFLCKLGVLVKAALGGEIVHVQDGLTKNWDKFEVPPKTYMPEDEQDGNYVVIKNDKDEFSIYSHLKLNSIKVIKGDNIKKGEVIGEVGDTGWSIKPHLHFMVFKFIKPKPARDFKSLKIRWRKNDKKIRDR